jgi:3-hydroxymyristoyl/3-hydroxydecanoyl-(acyl carrier protein) dehydratase
MMEVHIATFISGHYPEDNYILGVYSSEKLAEEAIDLAIQTDKQSNPNHPRRYQQNRSYYSIEEHEMSV